MPRILPFRGVRYDPRGVPDMTRVTAPPYDMISPAEQEELYRRDPHNVVRLILGRTEEGGRPVDRYATAAAAWRAWLSDGVLGRDPADALYLYREGFAWAGRTFQRLGLIARVGLDEFGGGAYAHELTMSGPKADRLRLLQACEANFSQIFALYSDPEGAVEAPLVAAAAGPPLVSFEDGNGVVHNLWRVDVAALIARAHESLAGKPYIIADAHHRYETALEYRRLMRQDPAHFRESMDSVMMCLIPAFQPNRYEYLYRDTSLSQIAKGGGSVHTPITIETADGLYLSIHEAALIDYSSMTLQALDDLVFKANLVPWSDGILVKGSTPLKTPWRTIQIAEKPGDLITSYLILNLNEPNALGDVSWVKPGKYIGIWWGMHLGKWTWGSGPNHGATTENTRQYIDFAAQNGFSGVLVEGWNLGWESGLTYPSFSDIAVKRAMIDSAQSVYLVADSSKIGARSFCVLGGLDQVDVLITDGGISDGHRKAIEAAGVKVIIAN